MTLSYLGSDSAIGTSGNVTVTFGVSLLQNDIVLAIGGSRLSHVPSAVTTGYTDALAAVNNPTGNEELWVGYKIMGATPDTTFVGTGTGTTVGIGYVTFYFRGEDTGTPIDTAATSAISGAASTNPDPPSITTVTDNAIVLAAAVSTALDSTITAPSGYSNNTQANSVSVTVAGAWKLISPAGAENPASWTNWSSGNWIAACVAIRPAAANANSNLVGGPRGLVGGILAA